MALHGELKKNESDDPLRQEEEEKKQEPTEGVISPDNYYKKIHSDPNQLYYATSDDRYRTSSDDALHIKRSLQEGSQYLTGVAVIRDARRKDAKSLGDPSVDQYLIEMNNTMLRVLGRLRSIDYVLMTKEKEEEHPSLPKSTLNKLREVLKTEFDRLDALVKDRYRTRDLHKKKHPFESYKEQLKQWEKDFNTRVLCQTLVTANLSEGCTTSKDFEKLLFHYRNLSALLDPAKSIVTLTRMIPTDAKGAQKEILLRRTEDPVTQKLSKQKNRINAEMKDVVLFPADEQKTFHTAQNRATQVANQYFSPLATDDTRMFAAQSRKKMRDTVRNTWRTTIDMILLKGSNENPLTVQANHRYQFMRSGTATYVGEGETDEKISEATKDNRDQIHQFLQTQQNIHWIGLVTDGIKEIAGIKVDRTNQKVMVKHTKQATEENKEHPDALTIASTNAEGLIHEIELSSKIKDVFKRLDEKINKKIKIGKKAKRIREIAKILIEQMKADPENSWIVLLWCASGQDRTGTVSELVVQLIIQHFFELEGLKVPEEEINQKKKLLKADKKKPKEERMSEGQKVEIEQAIARNEEIKREIEAISIASHHTAMIVSCLIGGSDGCKKDSHTKALFDKKSDNEIYLPSAKTNKQNDVDPDKLEDINVPSKTAQYHYQTQTQQLMDAIQCVDEADFVQESIDKEKKPLLLIAKEIFSKCPDDEKASCHDLYLMTEALFIINRFIQGEDAYKDKRDERCDYERLQNIREELEKQSHLKGMSKLICQFLHEKAKLDLTKQMSVAPNEPIEHKEAQEKTIKSIAEEISKPIDSNKVKVSHLNLFYEGIEIISDLMKGPQSYINRHGEKGLDYYDRDIKKLQIIQEKLNQWLCWKKVASLFMDFIGVAIVLGVIAVAAMAVMTAPLTGGSSLVALITAVNTLSIAIKAISIVHLALSLTGSAIAGCAFLLFGTKLSNTHKATQQYSSNLGEVAQKADAVPRPGGS